MPYANTDNKTAIRRQWDHPILARRVQELQRRLTYFGLCGPEIWDLIDWQEVLDARRTAVETLGHTPRQREEATNAAGTLQANVLIHGLSSGFQLLRGDVENVIIDAVDAYGSPPQINDGGPVQVAHFGFDVVNLDFGGGLGYTDKRGAAKRVRALKELFKRQQGHSFVLFLTVNLRDTLGDELEEYLRGLRTRNRGDGWVDTVDWYLSRGQGEREYKLKAVVPSFIHAISELQVFRCASRPPIFYEGHRRARLVHFAFELTAQQGNLRGFSAQDDRDLIEMPLLHATNGVLRAAVLQHPGFDANRWQSELAFLPPDLRDSILATVPPPNVAALVAVPVEAMPPRASNVARRIGGYIRPSM